VEQPFTLVQTDGYTGLTWRDVDDLVQWARSLRPATTTPVTV
jgi:hypothetical protein